MKSDDRKIQESLLKVVRSKYHTSNDMLDDLGRLLKLSRSGLYSKLNGRTNFNFNEVLKICRHFKLSLDYFVYQEKREDTPYSFLSDAVYVPLNSYNEYLENYRNHLDQLKKFNEVRGTYLCNELPFFYYLQFPELLAFKMYVWHMTTWKIEKYDSNFSLKESLKNNDLFSVAKQISRIYMSYPSIEIWNSRMLSHIVDEIIYFLKIDLLSQNDAKILAKVVKNLKGHLDKQLKFSHKILHGMPNKGSDIKIYSNDLMVQSELISIKSEEFNITYLSYDTPNYLRSYDKRICEYSMSFLDSVLNFSSQINVTGLKDRTPLLNNFNVELARLDTALNM